MALQIPTYTKKVKPLAQAPNVEIHPPLDPGLGKVGEGLQSAAQSMAQWAEKEQDIKDTREAIEAENNLFKQFAVLKTEGEKIQGKDVENVDGQGKTLVQKTFEDVENINNQIRQTLTTQRALDRYNERTAHTNNEAYRVAATHQTTEIRHHEIKVIGETYETAMASLKDNPTDANLQFQVKRLDDAIDGLYRGENKKDVQKEWTAKLINNAHDILQDYKLNAIGSTLQIEARKQTLPDPRGGKNADGSDRTRQMDASEQLNWQLEQINKPEAERPEYLQHLGAKAIDHLRRETEAKLHDQHLNDEAKTEKFGQDFIDKMTKRKFSLSQLEQYVNSQKDLPTAAKLHFITAARTEYRAQTVFAKQMQELNSQQKMGEIIKDILYPDPEKGSKYREATDIYKEMANGLSITHANQLTGMLKKVEDDPAFKSAAKTITDYMTGFAYPGDKAKADAEAGKMMSKLRQEMIKDPSLKGDMLIKKAEEWTTGAKNDSTGGTLSKTWDSFKKIGRAFAPDVVLRMTGGDSTWRGSALKNIYKQAEEDRKKARMIKGTEGKQKLNEIDANLSEVAKRYEEQTGKKLIWEDYR
jgi:hypothetical protein